MLNKSSAYLTLMIHETFPRWYKTMSYEELLDIARQSRTLNYNDYKSKGQLIPKGNGEDRPLNVPSKAWRLYLHSIQHILQVWLSPFSHPSQHGFMPGRGTLSAWKVVATEVIKSPDIFEYDLKKFFDTINLDYLSDIMRKLLIPESLTRNIILWNRTKSENDQSTLTWKDSNEKLGDYIQHLTGSRVYDPGLRGYYESQLYQSIQANPRMGEYGYYRGVAQGNPLSPLLSSLIVTATILNNPHTEVIQYADDGILYNYGSCDPRNLLTFSPESGISVNWEKSGFIRKSNRWMKPLIFLGIQCKTSKGKSSYKGMDYTNHTRTHPKAFKVDYWKTVEAAVAHDVRYKKDPPHPTTWSHLFETGYAGMLMAQIYNGTKDLRNLQHDNTLTYRRNTWLHSKYKEMDKEGRIQLNNESVHLNLDWTLYNVSSFACTYLCRDLNLRIPQRASTNFRQLEEVRFLGRTVGSRPT
jgi:hypothetical protein